MALIGQVLGQRESYRPHLNPDANPTTRSVNPGGFLVFEDLFYWRRKQSFPAALVRKHVIVVTCFAHSLAGRAREMRKPSFRISEPRSQKRFNATGLTPANLYQREWMRRHSLLFYFAEYPAVCCGDEGESRTLRSFSGVGLSASKNSADTSQLAARSFI